MVTTASQLWAQEVPGSWDSCWDQKGRLPFRSRGSVSWSPSTRFWFSRKIQKQVFIQNVPILKYCSVKFLQFCLLKHYKRNATFWGLDSVLGPQHVPVYAKSSVTRMKYLKQFTHKEKSLVWVHGSWGPHPRLHGSSLWAFSDVAEHIMNQEGKGEEDTMIVQLKQTLFNTDQDNEHWPDPYLEFPNSAELCAHRGKTHKSMIFPTVIQSGQIYILRYFLPTYDQALPWQLGNQPCLLNWKHMTCYLTWTIASKIPGNHLSLGKRGLQVNNFNNLFQTHASKDLGEPQTSTAS